MSTHRVRTNYFNPLVLSIGMLLLFCQAIPQFSIFRYLQNQGYSENFVFYSIVGIIAVWIVFVFLIVYYIGLKYIDVEITGEGVSANWFYGWELSDVPIWGRRVEGLIPWQDIGHFGDLPRNPMSWWWGFFIQAKSNKRYYSIGFLYGSIIPKAFKEMKADFEAHYEAYKTAQRSNNGNFSK